jgi:hypothetical protein
MARLDNKNADTSAINAKNLDNEGVICQLITKTFERNFLALFKLSIGIFLNSVLSSNLVCSLSNAPNFNRVAGLIFFANSSNSLCSSTIQKELMARLDNKNADTSAINSINKRTPSISVTRQ